MHGHMNVKFIILLFSKYCQHKLGRKRPPWVSNHRLHDNSKMDLGRTTYMGVNATKLWGYFLIK